MQINKLRTELLTALIAENQRHNRKSIDSKITNLADSEICKKSLLAVEYLIFTICNCPYETTSTFYKSMDRSAGQQADNMLNPDA
jgi:hypothetical protein